jgi:hypothetical protein
LVVGAIKTGAVSDDVKFSVHVADPDSVTLPFHDDVPSSWKFAFGVWIVAVYVVVPAAVATPAPGGKKHDANPLKRGPLVPVMVVVPDAMLKVALKSNPWFQLPLSEKVPG